jgi:cellulose synthase/poly-beta-1,6-N-acetylglucosamine synthase-like glycosyltransferase
VIALDIVLMCVGVGLIVPAAVFLVECLAAALPRRDTAAIVHGSRPRTAVVVPAHDEATVVAATVRHVRQSLRPGDRLLVVADNCSDQTAERARAEGAEVLERFDHERRGKGHALSFAFDALRQDPPEVVVVVDADCRLTPGSLEVLVREAHAWQRPIQAEYIMRPTDGSSRAAVSALAFLVRNRVRPRGLLRMGLPCHLTGSGMAFPWEVLVKAPPTGSHLVEDLVLGIALAERGYPPRLCPRARVVSELPPSSAAALTQRERWEHGQLSTLLERAPRLVVAGLRARRPDLVALGADLMVPPLALLSLALVAFVCVSGALWMGLGASVWPFALGLVALACVGVGVTAAWWVHARGLLPWRRLLAVPAYVLWKVPLYVAFAVGRRAKTWRRTRRTAEEQ